MSVAEGRLVAHVSFGALVSHSFTATEICSPQTNLVAGSWRVSEGPFKVWHYSCESGTFYNT